MKLTVHTAAYNLKYDTNTYVLYDNVTNIKCYPDPWNRICTRVQSFGLMDMLRSRTDDSPLLPLMLYMYYNLRQRISRKWKLPLIYKIAPIWLNAVISVQKAIFVRPYIEGAPLLTSFMKNDIVRRIYILIKHIDWSNILVCIYW